MAAWKGEARDRDLDRKREIQEKMGGSERQESGRSWRKQGVAANVLWYGKVTSSGRRGGATGMQGHGVE